MEYVVKIADDIIHAVPTQCLLLATDDVQDESGATTVAIDSIAGVEDAAAAAATVAMLLEAIDEVKEDGDAIDMIIWVTATLLCLPELDAMDDDGSEAKAAMYS